MSLSTSGVDRRPRRRHALVSVAGVGLIMAASLGAALTIHAATPVTAGYRDHLYGNPDVAGGDDVTAPRNQSKLWFHDGTWFALMLDNFTETYRIYKFNMTTQDWTSTGVAVDPRNRSHADVLSDTVTNTLYVASSWDATPVGTPKDLRVYKYTYNPGTKVYALVAGYPKLIPGTDTGTRNATIAKDGASLLWVAYTQALRVKVSSSTDGGLNWAPGADIPGMGIDATADVVAAIAPITGGVGVMWSNESKVLPTDPDGFYYQVHRDVDPVGTWQTRETVLEAPYTADDHISLKTTPSGEAIAAIKTGRDADPGPNGSDPLIAVVRRTGPLTGGTWTVHPVTTVTVDGTRPILVIDEGAAPDQANVFLTYPTLASDGAQAIYRRTATLSTLNFGSASIGTPVIQSATELAINDATSTKQASTPQSGMLVLAANIPTRAYLHACIGAPCPVTPVADFTTDTTSGQAPLAVQFTDTSTNAPTSWAWDFDGNGSTDSTAQNPLFTYTGAGTYTVALTATNAAGSDPVTKTNLITVSPPPAPVANFSGTPTSGTMPLTVAFSDLSTNGPTGWAWTFGDGGTSTLQNPSHTYALNGTYTVALTASNGTGPNTLTRVAYITVAGAVVRQSGADRYATAVAVSAANFAPGVPVVFIATGTNFPDALAGGPPGGILGGPILLVQPTAIPSVVQAELLRLSPAKVVILGGTGAVSGGVESQLVGMFGSGKVSRLAGANRYATAVAISQAYFSPGVPVVYLATGTNFPDALAGGPPGGKFGGPVLLVQPTAIPAAVQAELLRLNPAKVVILGGTGAVSGAVEAQLVSMFGSGKVSRLSGADRYATAVAISQANYAPNVPVVFVATGANFPDALAGTPPAGDQLGPILLVTRDTIPASVAAELTRLKPGRIVVLGGTGVISAGVATALAAYLGP